jgi:hypothetical protein
MYEAILILRGASPETLPNDDVRHAPIARSLPVATASGTTVQILPAEVATSAQREQFLRMPALKLC